MKHETADTGSFSSTRSHSAAAAHTVRACDVLAALLLCLVGCGPAETSAAGGQGAGAGGGQTTGSTAQGGSGGQATTTSTTQGVGGQNTGGGDSGGQNAGGGGSGGQTAIPGCKQSCATATDCVSPNPISFQDEDNYACENGVCQYTGCNSTAECQEYYSGFVCASIDGHPYKGCIQSCSIAADCVSPNASSFQDEDNYACESGVCQYTGCNSTAECQEYYSGFVCASIDGSPYKGCIQSCSIAADCVAPNPISFYDEDNYACESGVCRYTGCNSTAECQEYYSGFVCE